ncbi:MAG: glycoside hydrolase family 16 protein [bacterium]
MQFISIHWIRAIFSINFLFLIYPQCSKENSNPVESQNDSIPAPSGYVLVWHDEFNGSTINPDKWEHETNAQGGGNNELQYYTDRQENSLIEDGFLIITARKEEYTGTEGTREYTSARLRTKNKGDWKYGHFEIRAKLPWGQGIWPAIWMLPTDWIYGGWAASGEIDIMELVGHEPDKIYGTIHYGGTYPRNQHKGKSFTSPDSFNDDFHIFSLDWDTTKIRWYVDKIHYATQTEWYSENGHFPAPFDQRFHILLNVAVGGNWPGDPDNTTQFPQKMIVDYVRVFQKEPQ